MKTQEWTFVDKSEWKRGPWDNEVDKKQWQDETTGLPCLAVRGPAGAWCGYVGVTEEHPFFGKEYSTCIKGCDHESSCYEHSPSGRLSVHGGITFSDFCQENKEQGICHIVEDGENDKVYWFGFDTAHYDDLTPKYDSFSDRSGVYRDLNYVQQECRSLAEQLNNFASSQEG